MVCISLEKDEDDFVRASLAIFFLTKGLLLSKFLPSFWKHYTSLPKRKVVNCALKQLPLLKKNALVKKRGALVRVRKPS